MLAHDLVMGEAALLCWVITFMSANRRWITWPSKTTVAPHNW